MNETNNKNNIENIEVNNKSIEENKEETFIRVNIFSIIKRENEDIIFNFVLENTDIENFNKQFTYSINIPEMYKMFELCELFECNAGCTQEVYDILFDYAKQNNIGLTALNMRDVSDIIEDLLKNVYTEWENKHKKILPQTGRI